MNDKNFETALPEIFDPTVEEGSHFELLPIGTYVAQVAEATVSQPKSGDGWQVNLSWQITEGEFEGRLVWQRITFQHSSAQATVIGRRQFKDLCDAVGVSEQVTDVSVFQFVPCKIKVGIERDKNGLYEDKNRVSRILPLDSDSGSTPVKAPKPTSGPKPAAATAAAPPKAVAAAGAGGANGAAKPWQKQAAAAKPPLAQEMKDNIPY
jgi:hypothetical protein